ncbi:hypothetical protein [Mesorhizobium sp. LSJC265A00]|uniref:hypothetical protein n=1 Tax=Mesorhizobium sp. LSJC265A00 TaxID=1287322 RepID=UPI0009FF7A75|nr:hypothetical protein [Mesorhizobium sp. LSJC265A00]
MPFAARDTHASIGSFHEQLLATHTTMPPRDKLATEAVPTGSGLFKFNHALARPGASFTYDRSDKYAPRQERSRGRDRGPVNHGGNNRKALSHD